VKETIMEKTDEVEKILGGMKDIVNEFCSVSKGIEFIVISNVNLPYNR